jgi:hypothetical protein
MDCKWIATEELRNGKPLFRCERKGCPNVSASDNFKAFCRHPTLKVPLGDIAKKGIAVATLGLVAHCGGCQQRQENLNRAGEIPLPDFLVSKAEEQP